MKKNLLKYFLVIPFLVVCSHLQAQRFWVAATPSNWNNAANWSTTSGGPGGASVPGATDLVTFNAAGLNNCTLDVAPTIAGITVNGYTGIINLNGFTLTTTGTNVFTSGTINNTGGAASVALNTANATTFNGTTFGANLTGTSGRLHFNGSTFNGTINVTKTDANSDIGTGNNIFNNTATFTNAGTGYLLFGNANRDQFFGVTTFNNTGESIIYFAHNHPGQTTTFATDVFMNSNKSGGTSADSFYFGARFNSFVQFNGNLTINCAGAVRSNYQLLDGAGSAVTYNGNVTVNLTNSHLGTEVNLGTNGTSTYNGNIVIQNTSGAWGFRFNQNAASSSTLASGRTITLGGSFPSGNLIINRFTQLGATPQALTVTGTTYFVLDACTFNGAATFAAPILTTLNTTYNGITSLTKTGAISSANNRNNTFNSFTTITHAGDGEWLFGDGGADTFNANATINNTGSYRIRVAYNHSGQTTTFAGNLTINSNKTGGTDTWSFLSSESNDSHLSITGNLTLNVAGNLRNDFRFATTATSTFSLGGNLVINNTNTDPATLIQMGVNGTSTYGGNITLTNTGGSNGVIFNVNATASATQAATGTISIAGGFTSGLLRLHRFTNVGTSPLTLNLGGATTELRVGPSTIFGGNVDLRAPQLLLDGITVGGTAHLEKTGAIDNVGVGNNVFGSTTTIINNGGGYLRTNGSNTFNGATTLTNNSNGDLLLELVTGSTYNGSLTLLNTGTSYIRMAWNGATTFNGNIVVNSTAGTGVYFCENAAGTATLSAGNTITIGGSGFSAGNLSLIRFTQLGATPQTLTNFTGGNQLILGPATSFGGDVDFRAPRPFLNGVTVAGTAYIEKNGTISSSGTGNNVFGSTTTIVNNGAGELRTNGNNTFNGATTLINNSTGDLLLELASGSTYNGSLTLLNAGTSNIRMAYQGTNLFNGNIIVNSTSGSGIIFCESAAATSTLAAGNTITIGGSGFSSGNLALARFTQLGATPQTLTAFSGATTLSVGPDSGFGGNVIFTAPGILLNGCTYSGTAVIEKTGATNDAGAGGNIFNSTATITNSGSGQLITGNNNSDQFIGAAVFNHTGSYRTYFAHNHAGQTTTFASDLTLNTNKVSGSDAWPFMVGEGANIGLTVAGMLTINCAGTIQSNHRFLQGAGSNATFNGPVNINITNTDPNTVIQMGDNGTATYNGNIHVINSGGAAGITFNGQTSASSTLNGVITAGTFTSGSLNLYRFTQVGVLPENITLTGSSILRVGPNSSFDGNVNFVSPRLLLNGATYAGTTYLEKNGVTNDTGAGGNIFNGTTTLVNSGSGDIAMANSNPDIFNGALTITNTGSNWIFMAHNVPGNQFNNNIAVNSTGSSLGIIFSNSATGASTFTNGTITVGGLGFTVGDLRLRRFTQSGAIAQNVTLTGSARFWIGPNSSFDGNINFVAPRLLLNGATYNGITYLEKNGATNDDGDGGNIFNQTTTLVNSGSAPLSTGVLLPDIFNNNLVVTNSGSSLIRLADNAAGNQFNGNIELNSIFGGGIYFSNGTSGTSTLAATRTISVGSSGVISGDIRLIRFTQVGATPQNLNLTGIAILTLGPASRFDGNVDFRSPQVLLNGTTYNGTAYLEKKGANDNAGVGGNTFNSTTTLVSSGAGYFMTGNGQPDIFNGTLTLTNTGSNAIYLAHSIAGTQFNGNIIFNSTLGSSGVYFSENVNGSSTLASGAVMSIGGLGFSSGDIRFRRFTQLGATAQNLILTGTSRFVIGPLSTFNAAVNFSAPRIALEGAIYQGVTVLEKTGANDDISLGGNIFNNTLTIRNSGTGNFRFANTTLDTFNGDVTLINTGSSGIQMSHAATGTVFNGNIFVNSTFGNGISFGVSGGTTTLAAGRTISVGGTGFTLGNLDIRNFTQTGSTAQTLLLTGTSALYVGPNATFTGNADFRAPSVYMSTSTFNGTAYLEKTGATSNGSTGAMTFNGTTTIRNSGTGYLRTNGGNTFNASTSLINSGSDYLLLEFTSGSAYNSDLTLTNTGASSVRSGYAGATTYAGNILVNNTGTVAASGVRFGELAGATPTLANGRTLSVGGTGFTGGSLQMFRFTQVGGTPQSMLLTGNSTFSVFNNSTWNGPVTVSAPSISLNGGIFNGTGNTFTKTGAAVDISVGGNIFNGATSFISVGTGTLRLGVVSADDFVGDVVFNQVSGVVLPAYNTPSTFRGNVTVSGATAIAFGNGGTSGVAVFAGGNAQTISKTGGSASPIFRALQMNKSANAVTLNTDVSVTATANFTSGVLNTTATNIINFANNATSTGGSNASHVDGPVRKTGDDAFVFPTGDNGIYRGIGISAPTNVAHYFTAEYFKAAQGFGGPATYASPILTLSPCEYWMLDRNPVVGGSNVSVTLSWVNSECVATYITDPSTLAVARWNGSNWVNHGNGGTTGTAASGTVMSSGVISSFSPLTIASTSLANPLPIELVDFAGEYVNNIVNLQWLTASEVNNAYFTVEQSADGFEFASIGRVNGQGTVTTTTLYNFTDPNPYAEKTYYRLRQTDFDGTFTYSDVISVDAKTLEWNMYPNPVSHGTEVTLTQKGTYAVYNSMGNIVMTIANANKINISTLPAGVYIIRNAIGLSKRLVIQ